jgi:exonuclease SbcD
VLTKIEDGDDVDTVIEAQLASTVRALGGAVDPTKPAVFAGHCHVSKAKVGRAQALFGVSDVEVALSTLVSGGGFPYYALGHVHSKQELDVDPFVAYSGSLERVDFGEGERADVSAKGTVTHHRAEPKGFYRFDLVERDGSWCLAGAPEFREVSARRFVTIRLNEVEAADPIEDVQRRIKAVRASGLSLQDVFVRIRGVINAPDRGRVTAAVGRSLVDEAYDVQIALEADESSVVRDPRFAERMSEVEALERFIETKGDWAGERDELLRLGRELATEVLG